jgi:uncharacterized membrane protein
MMLAVFASVIAAIAGVDDLTSPAIWDKSQFRIFCLLGAIGGAFLAIALFPPREQLGNYSRRLALKFVSSGIAGLLFTPIIIRWQKWPIDVDTVLAVSGIVALVSVSIISALVPIFVKKVVGKFGDEADHYEITKKSDQ